MVAGRSDDCLREQTRLRDLDRSKNSDVFVMESRPNETYQQSIFADWGNKEVLDLMAGVDYAISSGIADPDRLGIGGWSYGAMPTNYTIVNTNRFKAAIAGAGSGLELRYLKGGGG